LDVKNSIWIYFIIVLGGIFLFLPFQTVHLFDWDEINFAEAAREMIITGDYLTVQIDFKQFGEKPPFFIWMQALSFALFGIGEFAARLPNLLCGILTLIFIFHIGKSLYNIKFALLWVLAYAGSILPQFYFMTGIIDPIYNLFIFSSLYFFFKFIKEQKNNFIGVSGFLVGLAVITKGPAALLIIALIYSIMLVFFYKRFKFSVSRNILQFLVFIVPLLLVSTLFYGIELIRHGQGFFEAFIDYHMRLMQSSEAGHEQPFYYHFIVLLLGCLPTSILMFGGLNGTREELENQKIFRNLMIIMLLVVLLVFSMVTTKIIHYSSLCYFPITYLAACFMFDFSKKSTIITKSILIPTLTLISILGFLLIIFPFVMKNPQLIIPYINDPFVVANLDTVVSWSFWEIIPGVLLLIAAIGFLLSLKKFNYTIGFIVLLSCTGFATNLLVRMIVPKIELITQGAPIEFYERLQGKDCYVESLGFKSYAHLFYFRKQPQLNLNSSNMEWLIEGDIDKPAYFVSKNTYMGRYWRHPNLNELYRKNGYIFFERRIPYKDL